MTASSTIQQTPSPWWCRLLLQRHSCGESVTPTPGSLFGRGRVRVIWQGFIYMCQLAKKLINYLTLQFHLNITSSQLLKPPKQTLHFPHRMHRLHLLSICSSTFSACFWLVVAYKIVYQQPFKGSVYFIVAIVPSFDSTVQTIHSIDASFTYLTLSKV